MGTKKFRKKRLSIPVCFGLPLLALVSPSIALASEAPDLNLSSESRLNPASTAGSIQIGNQQRNIQPGDLLTPAESIALQQILAGNSQTLQLNTAGVAVGGTFSLPSNTTPGALTIPTGVILVQDVSATSAINVLGAVNNAGTIYAVSSMAGATATLSALSITNASTGVISTALPSSLTTGAFINNLGLSLVSAQSISNLGLISSAGNLHLSAGQSVLNSQASAVIQAVGTINITAGSGYIQNLGSILSSTGNINMLSGAGKNLFVDNISGNLSAISGAINLATTTYGTHLALLGGDIHAQALNCQALNGITNINVRELLGLVSIKAAEAYVASATDHLNIGTLDLSGDPTLYNSSGSISIDKSLIFPGQGLAIVAATDIFTVSGADEISTASGLNGGDITMIAGANFVVEDPSLQTDPFGPIKITVMGASSSGGKIDLVGSDPISKLDSSGLNGGNIRLIAFKGLAAQSGIVNLPQTLTVKSGGQGSGVNGNVSIVTQASAVQALTVGNIDTTGGSGGGGHINLVVVDPTGVGKLPIVIEGSKIASGETYGESLSFVPATVATYKNVSGSSFINKLATGSIVAGSITANGSNITVTSEGNIHIDSIVNNALPGRPGGVIGIDARSASAFSVGAGPTVNGIPGGISSTGDTTGGTITLLNMTSVTVGKSASLAVNSNGAGGNLIISNSFWTLNSPNLTFQLPALSVNGVGPAGNGGSIILETTATAYAGGKVTFSADGAGTGNGGLIRLHDNSALNIAPGAVQLSAMSGTSGGGGGTIDLAAKALTIATTSAPVNPRGANGNGGHLKLSSAVAITITGPLNFDGVGSGNGGELTVMTSGKLDLAGTIVSAKAGPTSGAGGTISLVATDLTVNAISVAATNGKGGTLSLEADTLSVATQLAVDGAGNGDGGTLTLTASQLNFPGAQALSANGAGSGNGGSVTVTINQNTRFVDPIDGGVDGGVDGDGGGGPGPGPAPGPPLPPPPAQDLVVAKGILTISAIPGTAGVKGGSITLLSSEKLIVAPDAISVNGNGSVGGQLSFSGEKDLTVSGSLDVSGSAGGGSIYLESQNPAGLVVGKSAPSGIMGTLTANGGTGKAGSITIHGAPLTILDPSDLQVLTTGGDGGALALSSNGKLTIGGGVLAADGAPGKAAGKITLVGDVNHTSPLTIRTLGTPASLNPLNGISINGKFAPIGGDKLIADNILFNVSGNLVLAPNMLTPSSSTFNLLLFTADSMFINTGLSATRGVLLTTKGPAPLTIGAKAVNGITGPIQVAQGAPVGGSIGLTGTGGVEVLDPSLLQLGGNGGVITIGGSNTPDVIVHAGTLSADSTGPSGNGGQVNVMASKTVTAIGHVILSARGSGNGNGGSAFLWAGTGDVRLGLGAGEFEIRLTGGSAGSSAGNGGYFSTYLGDANVTVDPAAVQVVPLGLNGSAGTMSLSTTGSLTINGNVNVNGAGAGNGGDFYAAGKTVQINGSINANGPGLGRGGRILVVPGMPDATLYVGSAIGPNYVSGSISASSLGGGNAGQLHFAFAGNGSLMVNSALTTLGVAAPPNVNYGFYPAQVNVTTTGGLTIGGTGTIGGQLVASGTSVAVSLPGQQSSLNVKSMNSSAGPITISVPNLMVISNGTIHSSGGGIDIASSKIVNNGTIIADAPFGITFRDFPGSSGFNITGAGSMSSATTKFISLGNVSVTQLTIIGPVDSTAVAGTFKLTLGSTLSTSQILSTTSRSALATTSSAALQTAFTNDSRNLSTILGTDTLMRKISMLQDDAVNYQRSNQIFVLACSDGESDVYCDDETEVESDQDNTTILSRGKMLVDTGNNERVVKAGAVLFTIPAQSSALIEKKNGRVRAVAVGGKKSVLANVGGAVHALKPGQDLLVGDNLSEEEFISVEQAEGPIAASIEKINSTTRVRTSSVMNAIQREMMIGGIMVSIGNHASARHKRVIAHLDEAVRGENPADSIYADTHLSKSIKQANGKAVNVLHSLGTELSIQGERKLVVRNGCVFLEPKIKTLIDAGDLQVVCLPGIPVQVEKQGSVVKVKSFGGVHSLQVVVGNERTFLSAGQELCVSNEPLDEKKVFADGIGRRRIVAHTNQHVHQALSQFSISSALLSGTHMQRLLQGKDSGLKQEREKILKTAAVLNVIHHEPYKAD